MCPCSTGYPFTVQPGWLEVNVPSRTQVQTVSCTETTDTPLGPFLASCACCQLHCCCVRCRGNSAHPRAGLGVRRLRYPHALSSTTLVLPGTHRQMHHPALGHQGPGIGHPQELEGNRLNACLVHLPGAPLVCKC